MRQAAYANQSRTDKTFKVGDQVWLSEDYRRPHAVARNAKKKLNPFFLGSYSTRVHGTPKPPKQTSRGREHTDVPPTPAGNAKCVRESRKGRGKRARGKESRGGTRERKGKGRRKATGERQKDHIGHQKRQGKKEGREARAREGKRWEKASKERGNRSTDLETERERLKDHTAPAPAHRCPNHTHL